MDFILNTNGESSNSASPTVLPTTLPAVTDIPSYTQGDVTHDTMGLTDAVKV